MSPAVRRIVSKVQRRGKSRRGSEGSSNSESNSGSNSNSGSPTELLPQGPKADGESAMFRAKPGSKRKQPHGANELEDSNENYERMDVRKSRIVRRFVPKVVVHRFEQMRSRSMNKSEITESTGVVGFFDISGFSSLANDLKMQEESRNLAKDHGHRGGSRRNKDFAYMQGVSGAEELAEILNNTLKALVNFILESGGDIIKFAGDALIVVWQAELDQIPSMVAVACHCALKCTRLTFEVSSRQTSARTKTSLSLHTGVGCGQLLMCHVGGELDRWEFFIAGDANTQAAQAEGASRRDEVIISRVAYQQLQYLARRIPKPIELECVNSKKDPSFFQINSIKLFRSNYEFPARARLHEYSEKAMEMSVLNLAKAYIPRPVMQMIETETANVDEMRKVSVIFFNLTDPLNVPENGFVRDRLETAGAFLKKRSFSGEEESDNTMTSGGSSYGSATSLKKKPELQIDTSEPNKVNDGFLATIQERVKAVQRAAYSQYATLRQFIIDDKGCVAIVVSGLPPYYAEESAVRAVRVAANLIHTKKINAKAGICSGRVFCGAIGSDYRAEYSVTGECINLAARLMSEASPNTALCDTMTMTQATAKNARLFQFERKFVNVKGYSSEVAAYKPDLAIVADSRTIVPRPGPGSGQPGSDYVVIGQESVKADICRSIFVDEARPCKAILLEGPPGAGKSHLLQWAISLSSDKAKHVFYCVAEPTESKTPFAVWRPILQDILKLSEPTENEAQSDSEEVELDEDKEEEEEDSIDLQDLSGRMEPFDELEENKKTSFDSPRASSPIPSSLKLSTSSTAAVGPQRQLGRSSSVPNGKPTFQRGNSLTKFSPKSLNPVPMPLVEEANLSPTGSVVSMPDQAPAEVEASPPAPFERSSTLNSMLGLGLGLGRSKRGSVTGTTANASQASASNQGPPSSGAATGSSSAASRIEKRRFSSKSHAPRFLLHGNRSRSMQSEDLDAIAFVPYVHAPMSSPTSSAQAAAATAHMENESLSKEQQNAPSSKLSLRSWNLGHAFTRSKSITGSVGKRTPPTSFTKAKSSAESLTRDETEDSSSSKNSKEPFAGAKTYLFEMRERLDSDIAGSTQSSPLKGSPIRKALEGSSSCTNLESLAYEDTNAEFGIGMHSASGKLSPTLLQTTSRIRAFSGSHAVFRGKRSSIESRFFNVSTQSGDQHLAEYSAMVQRLRKRGRLRSRRLSVLSQILPGYFVGAESMLPEDGKTGANHVRGPSSGNGSSTHGSDAASRPRARTGSDQSETGMLSALRRVARFATASGSALEASLGSPSRSNFQRKLSPNPHSRNSSGVPSDFGDSELYTMGRHASNMSSLAGAVKSEKEEIIDLILMMIEETGRMGRTLFVIDDAQNLDDDSWEVLKRAIDMDLAEVSLKQEKVLSRRRTDPDKAMAGPRVRFLVSYRTFQDGETPNPHLQELLDRCRQEEIRVQPPTRSQTLDSSGSRITPEVLEGSSEDDGAEKTEVTNGEGRIISPTWCKVAHTRAFSLRESAGFLAMHRAVGVGADLLQYLYDSTGGNPGYLLNLFNSLVERNFIKIDSITGVAHVMEGLRNMTSDNLLLMSLPGHFVAEVFRRFDALSINTQVILQLASAIGKLVPVDLLYDLYTQKAQLRRLSGSQSFFVGENRDPGSGNRNDSFAEVPSSRGEIEPVNSVEEFSRRDALGDDYAAASKRASASRSRSSEYGRRAASRRYLKGVKRGLVKRKSSSAWTDPGFGASTASSSGSFSMMTLTEDEREQLHDEFWKALSELKLVKFFSEHPQISPEASLAGQSVVFKEDTERAVVYNNMTNVDKKLIHKSILEWYESDGTRQESFFPTGYDIGVLGYHAMLADEHLKAFTYFEAGLRESLQRQAYGGADLEDSVESFAFTLREISEGVVLERQISELIEHEVEAEDVLRFYRCRALINLCQFYILQRAWPETKACLKEAMLQAACSKASLETRQSRYSKLVAYWRKGSPRMKSSGWLLQRLSQLNRDEILRETVKVGEQAKILFNKVEKMQRKIMHYTEALDKISESI